jgi:tetratricopeptide (TPR) repeat protein
MNHQEGLLAIASEVSTQPSSLTWDEHYRIALQSLQSGDLTQAETSCREALALNSDHADLLHLGGTIFLLGENYDAAVEWISRAITREPKARYLAALGTALQGLGVGAEALKVFERAVELEPNSAEVWESFGHALDRAERPNEARLCFLIARAFRELPFLADCRSIPRKDWNTLTAQFNVHLQNRSRLERSLDPIHCFWSGTPLDEMSYLSLQSMIRQGHPVALYTYDNVANMQARVPPGVIVGDAENVVPRSIYHHAVMSSELRYFSDIFRYAVLYEYGGWWLDTDIVLVKPLNFGSQHVFCTQWSGVEGGHVCVGNVMRAPKGSRHMANLYRMSLERLFDEKRVQYGAVGSLLLSEYLLLSDDKELVSSLLPPTNFNAIDRREVELLVSDGRMGFEILSDTRVTGVHLWGKMWPERGLRFGAVPDQSVVGYLKKLILEPN